MHLHTYRIRNYRRLRDARIELAKDISIFVGSNNSGKTSAAQVIQAFLSGAKERFSLFDFSSHVWRTLDEIGALPPEQDAAAKLPTIGLDLWFAVSEDDLHLVLPLLPSSDWQGTQVGIRVEFAPRNATDLLQNYRARRLAAEQGAAGLAGGAGNYVAWPKSLSSYLERELHSEFELRYSPLDRAQFNNEFVEAEGYSPTAFPPATSGAAILKALVRVDFLGAQRHLADPAHNLSGGAGRAEDLSRRLSRFYKRNLEQRDEDHATLKALSDSEEGLNTHLMNVFETTLERIAKLGYQGLHNPRMLIKSAINPESVMSQDARVHYVIGEGETAATLPDSYNGLGFKNLIYMVVEILDVQARWEAESEDRPPLHLIYIEEPEAHLHAQLQQVFIRNVMSLVKIEGDEGGNDDEEEEKEFEVPVEGAEGGVQKRYGVSCVTSVPDAVTANRTLIQWLPRRRRIDQLLEAEPAAKVEPIRGSLTARVRVAYQLATNVEWNGAGALISGRTFEEAFGLENAAWCQDADRKSIGLKLRTAPTTPAELAVGLHRRVTGKHFDKTKFALEVLNRKAEDWRVPSYIAEGLAWLQGEVRLDLQSELEAAAEPPAEAPGPAAAAE